MNSETGEIKEEAKLTELEKKNGKWFRLPNGLKTFVESKPLSKAKLRREAYLAEVERKRKSGINV